MLSINFFTCIAQHLSPLFFSCRFWICPFSFSWTFVCPSPLSSSLPFPLTTSLYTLH
jgi:hypothetical protein